MTTARQPRLTSSSRSAVIAALAVVLFLAVAQPAWADHVVEWGVGSPDGPDSVESADPVDFEVLVSLQGEPLPGWPMTAMVAPDDGASGGIPFATDEAGMASFTVAPADYPGASTLTVELCDDDGCLYGSATVVVPVVAAPTSAGPAPSTSSPTTATSATIGGTRTRGGGGSTLPWLPLTVGGLAAFVVGAGLFFGPTRTRSRAAACGYGVKYVDGSTEKWMVEPDGDSLGHFRVEIRTDVTDPANEQSSSKDELVSTAGTALSGGADGMTLRHRLEKELSWDQQGAGVFQRARIRDVPVDGILNLHTEEAGKAFADLKPRPDSGWSQKVADRTDEETVVTISWHEHPKSTCGVKDSLTWKLSGRSRVDLSAMSACSWCGGDLRVGRFPGHPDAHEAYGHSTVARALDAVTSCDGKFAAMAGAECSVRSDRGGLSYDIKGDAAGVKTTGTPSQITDPTFEAGIGGGVAGTSLGAKVGWQSASNHNNQHQTVYRGHARATHKGDDVVIRIRNSIGTALDQTGPHARKQKASESQSRVNAQHQLVVTVTSPPLACGCEPPELELKLGESVDLGTASAGEAPVLEAGTDHGSHAEISSQGNVVGLDRRSSSGPWAGGQFHVRQL